MKLDTAQKILDTILHHQPSIAVAGWQDALKLGIEALERIKEQRGPSGEIGALGLPSETED